MRLKSLITRITLTNPFLIPLASPSPSPAASSAVDGPAPTPTSGNEYWCWLSPVCVSAYKSIQTCYNTIGGLIDPNDSSQAKAAQSCLCDPANAGKLDRETEFDACQACFRGANPRTDEESLEEWEYDVAGFCETKDPSFYLLLAQMLKFMAVAHTPGPYTAALTGPITVVTTLADSFTPRSGLNNQGTADTPSPSTSAPPAPPPPPPEPSTPSQAPAPAQTPTPTPTPTGIKTPNATGTGTPKASATSVSGTAAGSGSGTSTPTGASDGADAVITQTRSLIYNPSLLPSLLPSFWTHWLRPGRWAGQHQAAVTITAADGRPMLVVQAPAGGRWRGAMGGEMEKRANTGMGKPSGAGRVSVRESVVGRVAGGVLMGVGAVGAVAVVAVGRMVG
ncbi:uncharacterized protein BDZ99DRAFT_532977 [Mytilinidion resinicola]|uniref:Uncharacterized protein n=1 Tax=Mytilinidion resinicola TaxID=574789 RepID=A0A6A6YJ20_9PEZI|nr:uncharacterized protein BDZ99DRAFT_532977 [Mytilinidion resinicola]KAF2808852.1 hypothetical protein BDZ99DRAFT_532977 [Mytilinidion resinicola]